MAEVVAGLGHSLSVVLGDLGIHNVSGLQAGIYVLGATVFFILCGAVQSAIRISFMRCSARK
jgi:hypothetical protein